MPFDGKDPYVNNEIKFRHEVFAMYLPFLPSHRWQTHPAPFSVPNPFCAARKSTLPCPLRLMSHSLIQETMSLVRTSLCYERISHIPAAYHMHTPSQRTYT